MDLEQIEQMIEQQGDTPLTDEQMARLLTGNGDIAESVEDGEEAKSEVQPEPATEEAEVSNEEEKPVILAKDGVHTIEYEKLVEARDEAKAAREHAKLLQDQLAALQTERDDLQAKMADAAKQDAVAGTTEATDELLETFKQDYPEFYEVLKKETSSVESALLARIDALEKVASQISGQIAPVVEQNLKDAAEAHFKAIRDGVEDYDQIVAQSEKVFDWINSKPKALQQAYIDVVQNSTNAAEVVEVLNNFKRDTGFAVADSKKPDVSAVIAAATKTTVPKSLSDIPAGTSVPHDEAAAMLEMTPISLMGKFDGKTPDQILDMIGRVV